MSLRGLRVLNTRPLNQNTSLSNTIRLMGGIPIELPTLHIAPLSTDWLLTLPPLTKIDKALFISPNAVHYFFQPLQQSHINWPNTINNFTIGQSSANALSKLGIAAHHSPDIADSEHLLALKPLQDIHQQTILLIKGKDGRPLITETLLSRGANVSIIPVYERTLPKINEEYINSLWRTDAVDIILFTSQQAMQNLFTLFGKQGTPWILSKPCLVISPRIAAAARLLGIQTIITSSYDNLLNTLQGFSI